LDPISELAIVFEKPTADAERKRNLVLGFDPASKGELCSGLALSDITRSVVRLAYPVFSSVVVRCCGPVAA
jgi:hypothetical protein